MDVGLTGRAAFVGGASKGIGKAIAHGLTKEGCQVMPRQGAAAHCTKLEPLTVSVNAGPPAVADGGEQGVERVLRGAIELFDVEKATESHRLDEGAVVRRNGLRIDLRNHQRHLRVHAEGRRVIHHHRARTRSDRREFLRDRTARTEDHLVGDGDIQRVILVARGDGISERVIFREFFPVGLTAFDTFDKRTLGFEPTMSHVAARNEIRDLIGCLGLPKPAGQGGEAAAPHPAVLAVPEPMVALN